MELKKIIAMCENEEEFKELDIEKLASRSKYIIKGKDNFMSGWAM